VLLTFILFYCLNTRLGLRMYGTQTQPLNPLLYRFWAQKWNSQKGQLWLIRRLGLKKRLVYGPVMNWTSNQLNWTFYNILLFITAFNLLC
jgi:hypothetical protein